jgi:hypothetical protein
VLLGAVDLAPASIGAVAGSVVAAGPIISMLFEGWLDSPFRTAAVTALAAPLWACGALAHGAAWTRAEPEAWTAHAGLNAIGVAAA